MLSSEPSETPGCRWCREKWIWRSEEPRLLGQSRDFQVQVYRCGRCGTYWEEGIVNPRAISRQQALERLPDLEERERRAD